MTSHVYNSVIELIDGYCELYIKDENNSYLLALTICYGIFDSTRLKNAKICDYIHDKLYELNDTYANDYFNHLNQNKNDNISNSKITGNRSDQ